MIQDQCWGDWFDVQSAGTQLHDKPWAKPRLSPAGAGSDSRILDSQCKGYLNHQQAQLGALAKGSFDYQVRDR